jgi:hypothetical protein
MGEFNSFLLHFREIKTVQNDKSKKYSIHVILSYFITFGLKADRPTVFLLYFKILKLIASRPISEIR